MDNTQNYLVPGKLYLSLKFLSLPKNRGDALEPNKIYLFLDSYEVLSVFDGKPLGHREYHFAHIHKIIKPL